MPSIERRLKSKWLEPYRWSAQFITGHGSFQSFRNRFGINDSDLCTWGEPDSPEHVLKHCTKYDEIRKALRRQIACNEIVESQLVSKEKYSAFETFRKEVLIAKELTEAIEEEEEGTS